MFFVAGIFVYPFIKLTTSIMGINDFTNAGSHLLHCRVKKAAISTIIGGFKFGISVGFACIGINMLVSSWKSLPKVTIKQFQSSNIFQEAKALQEWSFGKGSDAEKTAQYCTYFFKDNFLTNYDLSLECLSKINSLENENAFKKWVLEDPISAAYQTSKYVDLVGLSTKKVPPLKECTNQNLAQNRTYNQKSSIDLPSSNKSQCDLDRIKYLGELLKQKNSEVSKKLASSICINNLNINICLNEIKQVKNGYFGNRK